MRAVRACSRAPAYRGRPFAVGAAAFRGDLLAYARSSAAPLLPLFDELRSELGGAGEAAVRRLSGARAEWHFDPGDRAGAAGTHACALCHASCRPVAPRLLCATLFLVPP